ncbi:MAG: CPBP family intramembrane metalloprotease [Oscillospiraceae bacterium]|jgi:membrane protease YdiL (CAAX protease family)|nr:CPBP family intramembrane metalloprotease [Oscillospiraceae bacterium]
MENNHNQSENQNPLQNSAQEIPPRQNFTQEIPPQVQSAYPPVQEGYAQQTAPIYDRQEYYPPQAGQIPPQVYTQLPNVNEGTYCPPQQPVYPTQQPVYPPQQPVYPAQTMPPVYPQGYYPPQTGYVAPQQPIVYVQPPTAKELFRKDCGRVGGTLLVRELISVFVMLIILIISFVLLFASSEASFSDFLLDAVDGDLNTIIIIAMSLGLLAGNMIPFLFYAKKRDIKFSALLGKSQNATPAFVFKAAVVILAINYIWQYIYSFLAQFIPGMEIAASEIGEMSIPYLIVYAIMLCVIAPITEEIMFRGAILMGLRRYGLAFAMIVSSLMFGLIHGNLQQIPFAMGIGVVLAYVAVKTGSLRVCILLHFINNAFATILTYANALIKDPTMSTALEYFDFAFGILVILGSIIIFITNIKRLDFPKDSPEIKTQYVKRRYAHFFSSAWNLVLVCIIAMNVALTLLMPIINDLLMNF